MNEYRSQLVLYEGNLVNIQTFSTMETRKRPIVHCPICNEPVTLKLGKIKVFHYAHHPDSVCSFGSGESALHFDAKHKLAGVLKECARWLIDRRCYNCKREMPVEFFAEDWDLVEVESRIGPYVGDVVLKKNNRPLVCAEIYNTHLSEEGKLGFLEENEIRFIEIQAINIIRNQFTAKYGVLSELSYIHRWPRSQVIICSSCSRRR